MQGAGGIEVELLRRQLIFDASLGDGSDVHVERVLVRRAEIAAHLPDYMIPSYFKWMESFPLTDNGKVDRKALRNLAVISKEENTDYVAPETEFEKMLSEIWSEVLQIDKIGVHDNFLELGGNSLAAIRITSRINNTFDLELPVNTVFEKPNIRQLADHIEKSISTMLETLNK